MKDVLLTIIFGGLFAILFLPLYVENDFFFPFITGKNFAFRIIVEIIFASWVLLALLDTQYRPKFSWILGTFALLLGVMAVANTLGEYPLHSFMSNFERMDGYVTLVHVFLLVVVLGSVFTTQKVWTAFLQTSIVVAVLTALYGLGQQVGIFEGGRDRVDSRLGNAAYMAVYMLFHIFFVYLLALKSKSKTILLVYALAGLILAYTMLQTGTRGTFIGLIGGSVVTISYIALFGRKDPTLRKFAIGGLLVLLVLTAGFNGIRDTVYVQDTSALARIANIDIKNDLQVRSQIWSLAVAGIKERPLLGWGQGNFNYVFNEQYQPELWDQEQWFDRVHNIFLDWLIAGGVLGFVAYFSIVGAIFYYLSLRHFIRKETSPFSVPEQAVLIGLIVAYVLHNSVVFDNIISYIFYGVVLAYVHTRAARPVTIIERLTIDPKKITRIITPVVVGLAAATIYFVNVPGIKASGSIIDALQADNALARLEAFDTALNTNSFAQQEVVEQLVEQAMKIAGNANVPAIERQMFMQRTEFELLALAKEKPGDARVHNFTASYYRTVGALADAREQAKIAHELSPRKPSLIIEQALVELQANNLTTASAFLDTAYTLAPDNPTTVVLYAATLMQIGENERAKEIVGETYKEQFALSDFAIASVSAAGDTVYLVKLYELRIAADPENAENRTNLAFLYYQEGENEQAVATLEAGFALIPAFRATSACYVSNLRAGIAFGTPCTKKITPYITE